MLVNIKIATQEDAEALAILNQEFNGGDMCPVSEIINSLNSNMS